MKQEEIDKLSDQEVKDLTQDLYKSVGIKKRRAHLLTKDVQTGEKKDQPTAPVLRPKKEEEPKSDEPKEDETITKLVLELVYLESDWTETIERAKKPDTNFESIDQVRVSSSRLLRAAGDHLIKCRGVLDELKKLHNEVSTQAKGLEKAKEYINNKSADFRLERDGFIKLRQISEGEFLQLVKNIRDNA